MIKITATLAMLGAATSLHAQTVEPTSVLGDTTMPSSDDVSQVFPDGTIMRSIDDFKLVGKPYAVRIRFLKEAPAGERDFVSELPPDADASFAEQMPIIRKDGSLFTFYRARKGEKFAESTDGGRTWKPGGYYPMQFSIKAESREATRKPSVAS